MSINDGIRIHILNKMTDFMVLIINNCTIFTSKMITISLEAVMFSKAIVEIYQFNFSTQNYLVFPSPIL